jgi:hypothetical protein
MLPTGQARAEIRRRNLRRAARRRDTAFPQRRISTQGRSHTTKVLCSVSWQMCRWLTFNMRRSVHGVVHLRLS